MNRYPYGEDVANGKAVSVTNTSQAVALPAVPAGLSRDDSVIVQLYNDGAGSAFYRFGGSDVEAAAPAGGNAGSAVLPVGAFLQLQVRARHTHIALISATTATVHVVVC